MYPYPYHSMISNDYHVKDFDFDFDFHLILTILICVVIITRLSVLDIESLIKMTGEHKMLLDVKFDVLYAEGNFLMFLLSKK